MPRNTTTGAYSAPSNTWNPAVDGTVLSSADWAALLADMSTALGHTTATTRAVYPTTAQVQDGTPNWAGTAAGTANALTITMTPAITEYTAGQTFRFLTGAAANTSNVTLAVNGLSAQAVNKGDGTVALVANDLPASSLVTVVYDGTRFRLASVFVDTPPAIPTNSSGAGQFAQIGAADNTALVLAAGGTWAYFASLYTTTSNEFVNRVAGVAAGGSTVGAANVGQYWIGFAWRVR